MTSEFELADLGWKSGFEQQILPSEESLIKARVASHQGSQVIVLTTSGEVAVPAQLTAGCDDLGVGDWILLDSEFRAVRRLDRESLISRKAAGEIVREQVIAANVDSLFIVSSCNLDFNLARIERYLAVALDAQVTPVVVLTKSDLCDDPADYRQRAEQLHSGLVVEVLDARELSQVDALQYWCRAGQTVALVGSSGVGKSTLTNTLGALGIKTSGIREDDAKGRHTTTARMMHQIRYGGWLIDNPGMRELQLPACEQGIEDLFEDVVRFFAECRYRDCAHQGDAGCAVELAVEAGDLDPRRLRSFLKLQSEQSRNSQTLAERRAKSREQGRFYKSVIQSKKKLRDQR